ncbi:MAG: alanine racemase [Roseitalea sp.]|jgi:alanine racemase|nr:alanine racemase [Roseitalea sp.]MBO6722997.1 alanine racemase [Roseitalea sp.]MBO6744088.1 alanine racemase [Roseitalea sp.]
MAGRADNGELCGGRLTIDLGAIIANWRDLDRRSRPGRAAAVVKADAYGLGAHRVVPALASAGCDSFFVALPGEGVAIRPLVPEARIFVLNGAHADTMDAMIEAGLIPILCSMEQARFWLAQGGGTACAIQVDTGMNRLGLTVGEAYTLASDDTLRGKLDIVHVMSHFACADTPDHPLNRQQIESFQAVAAAFESVESSLSNSAATLTGGAHGFAMTRPGIALYGGEAVPGIANSMRPVVTLKARIVQIRSALSGETVSYGATQRLDRDSRIAIASVGYADGYPRAGSGSGVPLRNAVAEGLCGFVARHRAPVLGRVTMDLTAFDVTDVPDAALAEGWIELIGPNRSLDDVARASGTIGYEILTSLGTRYARRYRGEGRN